MMNEYLYASNFKLSQYEEVALQFKGNSRVEARYAPSFDMADRGHRLMEALPCFRNSEDCFQDFMRFPQWTADVRVLEPVRRRQLCSHIRDFRMPMEYLDDIHNKVYELLAEGYRAKVENEVSGGYAQYHYVPSGEMVHGACIIGNSGAGKTTAVLHALSYYPRMIIHEMTDSRMLQIPYIYVECPPDASVKAFYDLCLDEIERITGERIPGNSARMTADGKEKVFRHQAMRFNVGLVVVDEIQNIAGNRKKMLMKHILNLSNELSIPFLFVGTDDAKEYISSEGYYITRRIGNTISVGRISEGYEWNCFLGHLWKYQWTREAIPLTDELSRVFYDESRGNVDRVKELYRRCQEEAIIKGKDTVSGFTVEFIQNVSEKIFGLSRKSLDRMSEWEEQILLPVGQKKDYHKLEKLRNATLQSINEKKNAEQLKYNIVENVSLLSGGKFSVDEIERALRHIEEEAGFWEKDEGVLSMEVIHFLVEKEKGRKPQLAVVKKNGKKKTEKVAVDKETLPMFSGL